MAISQKQVAALGWTRTDNQTLGQLKTFQHVTGWTLQHCGHPTAHHPWVLRDPDGVPYLTGILGPEHRPDYGTPWRHLLEPMTYVFQLTSQGDPRQATHLKAADDTQGGLF